MNEMSIYWPVDTKFLFARFASSRETVFRRVRFPGITRFAREHGYNYVSVYRHLTGERVSKTIAKKWDAWKASKRATA